MLFQGQGCVPGGTATPYSSGKFAVFRNQDRTGKEVRVGTQRSNQQDYLKHTALEMKGLRMKKTLAILFVLSLALFAFSCKKEENTNVTDTAATDTSSTMSTATTATDTATSTMATDTTGTGTATTDTSMTATTGTPSTTDTSMTGTSGTTGTTGTTTTKTEKKTEHKTTKKH